MDTEEFNKIYQYKRRNVCPQMERDERGRNVLTQKFVIAWCEFNGQYSTPKANT